ncbi:MAG: hypothetical protein FWG48_05825 [Oscillospiraceae bacterium]|nr:hypothetical protein [Oscillospiraceae bacterium]
MLEGILKGLLQWLYGLVLEMVEYIANSLLDVFSMDLSYFEASIPVASDIFTIILATGWALLLGNLVFQASKSMVSGLGFEGEDPKTLFARTFVFAFFLLASRQICNIGLGISQMLIVLLQIPSSISIHTPQESFFNIGASWLLVLIVGVVLMWQIVKLFFAVGERYFLTAVLTLLAPWAFAMGGSRNTSEIFKGWARMFASMCLMMVLNVVFLKILLSAMGIMPTNIGVVPWLILLVAIARTAKKIDGVILRIGLSPSNTGGQGRGLPGMLSFLVMRMATSHIMQAAGGGASGKSKAPPNGGPKPSGAPNRGSHAGAAYHSASNSNNSSSASQQSSVNNNAKASAGNTSNSTQTAKTVAAGKTQPTPAQNTPAQNSTAQSAKNAAANAAPAAAGLSSMNTQSSSIIAGAAGTSPVSATASPSHSSPGAAGMHTQDTRQASPQTTVNGVSSQQASSTSQSNNSRRSSVSSASNARASVFGAGAAGKAQRTGKAAEPLHPPIPRSGSAEKSTASAIAPPAPQGQPLASKPARYSAVPPNARATTDRAASPGAAGTPSSPSVNQGGASISARNQANINASNVSREQSSVAIASGEELQRSGADGIRAAGSRASEGAAERSLQRRGAAGTRITSVPTDNPKGAAGTLSPPANVLSNTTGAAGSETRRSPAPSPVPSGKPSTDTLRGGRNSAAPPNSQRNTAASQDQARQEQPPHRRTSVLESSRKPTPGAAGKVSRPPNTPYPVRKPDMAGTRQSATAAGSSVRIGKTSGNRKKARGMRAKKNRKGKK